MSWPADGRSRFVVSTVNGWRINAGATGTGGSGKAGTSYAVRDRAYSHAIVAEYASEGERGAGTAARMHARARANAEAVAAERNAEHAADAA